MAPDPLNSPNIGGELPVSEMATWGRFGASLRNFFRSSWTLSGKVPLKPVVGGAVLGCLVAGGVLRYRHDTRWQCLHPAVFAKETAVWGKVVISVMFATTALLPV